MSKPYISPSLLASDFSRIKEEVEMLNDSEADYIHVDVMDGRFVPNISFGIPVVDAINRHAKKPLDVHLMIVEPEKYVEAFVKAGAEIVTVHYEACPHLHRNLQQIADLGAKRGVALNPHTPVEVLVDVINDIDLVLIMSVNPGFGGQKFIERTYDKVRKLKALIAENNASVIIEIDGGVNQQNAPMLLDAGADMLVAGSFVFKSDNPQNTISNLKSVKA